MDFKAIGPWISLVSAQDLKFRSTLTLTFASEKKVLLQTRYWPTLIWMAHTKYDQFVVSDYNAALDLDLDHDTAAASVLLLFRGGLGQVKHGPTNHCLKSFSFFFFSGEMSNRFLKSSLSSEASHVLRDFAKNVEETRSSSKTWRTHPKTERTSWFGKIGLYRRLFIHWLRRIIWSYVHHMSLVFLICFQVKNELTTSIEDGKGEVSFS